MRQVFVDMTPWIRGRFTGVGLSVLRSYLALKELKPNASLQVGAVSRKTGGKISNIPISRFTALDSWFGRSNTIYHGFESYLPSSSRFKKVLTVYDLWTLEKNPYQSAAFQSKKAKALRQAIQKADFLVTSTKFVEEKIRKQFPQFENASEVIPLGPLRLSDETTSSATLDGQVLRSLGIQAKYLLCVGCLETRKNQNYLIDALSAFPDFTLVLVGTTGFGSERIMEKIESAKEKGLRIIYFSSVSEAQLEVLYRNAIALVQPSKDEGFGMPVLEAMAMGVPVVLSNIAPFRELAGDAALYFSLADKGDELRFHLSKSILSESQRQDLSSRARDRSLLFSWEKTAKKMADVYRRLI